MERSTLGRIPPWPASSNRSRGTAGGWRGGVNPGENTTNTGGWRRGVNPGENTTTAGGWREEEGATQEEIPQLYEDCMYILSRWEKDGSPVGMFPGKYAWSGEVEAGDCSINILHAEREFDHGKKVVIFC